MAGHHYWYLCFSPRPLHTNRPPFRCGTEPVLRDGPSGKKKPLFSLLRTAANPFLHTVTQDWNLCGLLCMAMSYSTAQMQHGSQNLNDPLTIGGVMHRRRCTDYRFAPTTRADFTRTVNVRSGSTARHHCTQAGCTQACGGGGGGGRSGNPTQNTSGRTAATEPPEGAHHQQSFVSWGSHRIQTERLSPNHYPADGRMTLGTQAGGAIHVLHGASCCALACVGV
jgi:hypothetical protein|mmetsp:Transcript_7881/g.15170  ORF Transcript_7881/g.15170 Transcript_7881/m.15170 type:complete len:224 (-) Transcript_7881:691-1362(-)